MLPSSPGWYARALFLNACQLAVVVLTNDAELTSSQVELIKKIIEEIERHTHRSVRDFSREQRTEYVELLSSKLLEISRQELRTDAVKGRTLLNTLRSVTGR